MRAATISELMMRHNIERIVYVPKGELLSWHSFHAWPIGGYLAEHCGRGETVEEAIHDAVARREREAA